MHNVESCRRSVRPLSYHSGGAPSVSGLLALVSAITQ